jgi:hypothetical protein
MKSSIFIALILSLPSTNKTARMRIWRALRGMGCGVLRDGVYLLPGRKAQQANFAGIESSVKAAGGFAMTVEMNFKSSAQRDWALKLFDRTDDYAMLVSQIRVAEATLANLQPAQADGLFRRLSSAVQAIAAIDFYPGRAKRQALDALAGFERAVQNQFSPNEPRKGKGRVRHLNALDYQGKVWATRKSPWIDRLASAWLIKRFVDRRARFVWIGKPKEKPRDAIGFDFDGAEFTHTGNRVTFEVLLSSFGLDQDPALNQLAAVIHFLDVGGIPVADARGLEMILKGVRHKARRDDALVSAAARVFDHVYSAYQAT